MGLINLLVIIILLIVVYRLLGEEGGLRRIFGGAAKKKPAVKKKPAKKQLTTKSAPSEEKAPVIEKEPSEGHEISESEACIKRLNSNDKKVVARLQAPYFDEMKPGDKITFVSREGSKVVKTLKDKKKYSSFKEMFAAEGLQNVFPGSPSEEDAIKHYREFYSEEQEKTRGVIALHVE